MAVVIQMFCGHNRLDEIQKPEGETQVNDKLCNKWELNRKVCMQILEESQIQTAQEGFLHVIRMLIIALGKFY